MSVIRKVIRKDLGEATAYAYAVSKGYTGTEEEFAELMASYADVAEDAAESATAAEGSATAAAASASAAQGYKTDAQTAATSAGTSASTATTKASEAANSASQAAGSATSAASSASTATTKASQADTAAGNAATNAIAAAQAASMADTKATDAAASATAAAGSATQAAASASSAASAVDGFDDHVQDMIETIPEDYTELAGDVTQLKTDLSNVDQKINFGLTGIRSLADRTSEFVPEYYIPNGGVGTTVDITAITKWSTSSTKAAYCLFEVQKGDIIHAEGYSLSGSTNRFMVLLDSDKNVVWSTSTGASARDITVTVTVDGYCLIDAAHYSSNQYREHKAIQLYGDTYKALEQDTATWKQYKGNGYVEIAGEWEQGEFGSSSSVSYAAKAPWKILEKSTTFICTDPENYYLTFYINNNGTLTKNTSYPTWAVFQANTNIRVAVNAKDETETLSPDSAKTKVLISLAISENERLKDTYSSVGVFDQIGIIGDSFAVGSMHWDNDGYKGYPNLSWGKLMCKRNGNNCTLYAHGGYGIKRFVEYILSTVLTDDPCNLYWWGLGINDNETARTNPTATGTIEDITAHETDGNYPDTIYGNFGRAVSQIKAHAPLAKHVFASCIKDNVNNRYTSYSAINTVLKTVAEHYGFPFIEITDDPFYWSAFYRDSAWTGHPVLIGYAGMSWANERLLNKCIVDNMTYFRDYGRTNNPDDTDPMGTE